MLYCLSLTQEYDINQINCQTSNSLQARQQSNHITGCEVLHSPLNGGLITKGS